jgi:hypothetical protein
MAKRAIQEGWQIKYIDPLIWDRPESGGGEGGFFDDGG